MKHLVIGTLRQWHWISSALCLAGMLLFAVTGITLNHAAGIESQPQVRTLELQLPDELRPLLPMAAEQEVFPAPLHDWLQATLEVRFGQDAIEWSADEIYVGMPRPGGDAWLTLDLQAGEVFFEDTDRGWIAYANDLHKGRHSGAAWSWFIDIFAGVCVIFSLTGLLLLRRQARNRPSTWPVTGLGLLIPVLIALLFIH
ncbi:PepSY-associated TM helix domain-containing protein [Halopseudomonas sp. SMJS2]|uniref:PepSY-associated TM helix domain-containing protein n=1 Tax=Halopseudomonas sp. SMJS2 TaxID=3041098 RepID=UPI00245322F4|nr:PepSY-associated TM helix domain-containing protein [Halopseudomonas sp. SMJS2]WGK63182.1 PepSY-associated TM helix domain-containing protein [Halopseudomonas sp. SMJS2]